MGETHTSDVRVNGPTVGFFIALREIQEDVTFFFCVSVRPRLWQLMYTEYGSGFGTDRSCNHSSGSSWLWREENRPSVSVHVENRRGGVCWRSWVLWTRRRVSDSDPAV